MLLFENGDLFRDTLGLDLFVGSDRSAGAIFTLMRAVRSLVVNGKPPAKKTTLRELVHPALSLARVHQETTKFTHAERALASIYPFLCDEFSDMGRVCLRICTLSLRMLTIMCFVQFSRNTMQPTQKLAKSGWRWFKV